MDGNKGDSESTFIQRFKNISEKIRSRGARKPSFRFRLIEAFFFFFLSMRETHKKY